MQYLKVFVEIKSKSECTRDTELLGTRKKLISRIHKAKGTEIQGGRQRQFNNNSQRLQYNTFKMDRKI